MLFPTYYLLLLTTRMQQLGWSFGTLEIYIPDSRYTFKQMLAWKQI